MLLRRLAAIFAVVGFLFALAAGCSPKPERKPVKPQVKIGLSVADAARDGNIIIRKVMEEKGRAEKIKIVFADAGNDPSRQEKDVERFLKKERVRAAVIQFVDPVTAGGMVRRLNEAGVKVVALETLVPNAPFDAYVASDHTRAGELLARFFLKHLPGGGKAPARVLFLGGDPGDPGMAAIASAFQGVFGGYPQVEVLVENVPRTDPREVPALVDRVFSRYGGAVDTVAAADSRLAVAAVEVLRSRGLADKVVTAGVGADRRATDLLGTGQHEAEVDVQPEMLGKGALTAAAELVKRGDWRYETRVANGDFSVPSQIVPVRLIRPESLYLLTERWKKYGGGGGEKGGDESSSEGGGEGGSEYGGEGGSEYGGEGGSEYGGEGGSEYGGEGGSEYGGEGGSEGEGGGKDKKKKTTIRITTKEGGTLELKVPGEVKKIETVK